MTSLSDLNTSELITHLGLINKVSTGHAWWDIVVCILLPPTIKALPTAYDWVNSTFFQGEVYTRSIEFLRSNEYVSPWSRSVNENPPNILLQNAVMAYINSIPGIDAKFHRTSVQILLGEEPLEKQVLNSSKDDNIKHALRDLDGVQEPDFTNVYRYHVNFLPEFNHWIDVDPHIRFTRREIIMDKDANKIKIVFVLKSVGPDGGRRINEFLNKALEYYKQLRMKKGDQSRFLYIPCAFPGRSASSTSSDKKAGQGSVTYKRYKLSERKTFDNLYHPDKQDVVRLVDDFMAKRGKFAIPGYPDKLGFLLHGPPGTGKTSFIKALAQYTGRSVVSIPLARISTNQELMDLMFDQRVAVEGDDMPLSLPFSKSIFVIEDVDAASKVVRARRPSHNAASPEKKAEGGCDDEEDQDDPNNNNDNTNEDVTTELVQGSDGSKKLVTVSKQPVDDALNLAGLLNVLDGVVDTPDRILVMTTNHPEKLDPALTRPGRVTKQIYMGYMGLNEAVEMLKDFYADLERGEVRERLVGVFEEGRWTPAEVEAKCALYDTVDEFIADMQREKGCA